MSVEEVAEAIASSTRALITKAQTLERRVIEQDRLIGELEDQVFELQQQLAAKQGVE